MTVEETGTLPLAFPQPLTYLMFAATAAAMQAPTVLSPCCSIDPNYGRLLWAINNEPEPVILETYKIQTWFDRKYNISHEIYDLKFND